MVAHCGQGRVCAVNASAKSLLPAVLPSKAPLPRAKRLLLHTRRARFADQQHEGADGLQEAEPRHRSDPTEIATSSSTAHSVDTMSGSVGRDRWVSSGTATARCRSSRYAMGSRDLPVLRRRTVPPGRPGRSYATSNWQRTRPGSRWPGTGAKSRRGGGRAPKGIRSRSATAWT
jgi:hypothetical protein